MRNFLFLCGFYLVLAAIIVMSFYVFMPGPAVASPVPAKFEVYFLTLGDKGRLLAYGPAYSVGVVVKIDVSTVPYSPYVEVPKRRNEPIKFFGEAEGEYVAWGYGGTLHVKDRKQLEELLLR